MLKQGFNGRQFKLDLLYRGTRDGFSRNQFMPKFFEIPNNLFVVKSEHNLIFGAYASLPWKNQD